MSWFAYKVKDGIILVNNQCPKCGRFIKGDDCNLFYSQIGVDWEIEDAIKTNGKCKKCGEVELWFEWE